LKDHHGKEWTIDISQARVRGNLPLTKNIEIKILGKKVLEDFFKANEIRIPRGFQQGKGKR